MDELDRRLLNELQGSGYQKSKLLSARLGLGERTIRRRISALRSKNIIKVIAVPKPLAPGYRAWAKIGIKVEPRLLFDVAQEVIRNPLVYFVAYSLGIFDIMIAVRCETLDRLTYFVNSELAGIKGIVLTETMILTYPRKYYNFSLPEYLFKENDGKEYYHHSVDTYSTYEIDSIDQDIINILSEDALTPIRTLKARLGIGEGTIRKRIKRMLKEEVFKIEVVPNPESLEYEVWATMGLAIDRKYTDDMINAIIENPEVYLVSMALGRFNIVIAGHFRNIDALNEFTSIDLARIEGISATEIFLHTRPLKYHNNKW